MNERGAASGTDSPVKARLKWFNGPKGFGFVVPENENIDAFLHVTTLQRAGIQTLSDGACLLCHIERGPKGAQVREVLALLDPQAVAEAIKPAPAPEERKSAGEILRIAGRVKWYKPEKGFGFVEAEDGMKDVFVHKTCLDRHGLATLEPGMRLFMTVRVVPRGREAVEFDLID